MCYSVEEIKQISVPIAQKYGVKELNLFGSYARGDATDQSDVDFYIKKGEIRGLIEYFSFLNELENALHCHVDVITTDVDNQKFLKTICKEGVQLYAE